MEGKREYGGQTDNIIRMKNIYSLVLRLETWRPKYFEVLLSEVFTPTIELETSAHSGAQVTLKLLHILIFTPRTTSTSNCQWK